MSSDMEVSYQVNVTYEGPEHGFWAEIVELPGCFASGFTVEELNESIQEAIELYLSTPDSPLKIRVTDIKPEKSVETRSFQVLTNC